MNAGAGMPSMFSRRVFLKAAAGAVAVAAASVPALLKLGRATGHDEIVALMEQRIRNTDKAMQSQLDALLWGQGSGPSFGGLAGLVKDASPGPGEIDRSTDYAWTRVSGGFTMDDHA